jgi:hypothetical protein
MLDEWNRLSEEAPDLAQVLDWKPLSAATGPERQLSLKRITAMICLARKIRDNPPGVNLDRPTPKEAGAGTGAALDELFAWWRGLGLGSRWIRARWNAFPITVRRAIAGNSGKRLWNIAPGKPGRWVIHRNHTQPSDAACKGGGRCPRARKYLDLHGRGKDEKQILAWYRRLTAEERKRLCTVHYRVPTTAKTIRGEIAKAKADTKGRRTFSDFAFPKGPKAPAGKPVGGSRAKPAKKSGAGRRIDKRTQTVIDALRNNLRRERTPKT